MSLRRVKKFLSEVNDRLNPGDCCKVKQLQEENNFAFLGFLELYEFYGRMDPEIEETLKLILKLN